MANAAAVFDLGELETPRRSRDFETSGNAKAGRAGYTGAQSAATEIRVGPTAAGLATSLSILLPGTGQMLMGELTRGLAVFTSIAFLCAFGWAIVATFDRVSGTLALFGAPPVAGLWTLAAVYFLAAVLHLCGVLQTHSLVTRHQSGRHPAVAGAASLIIPGWGQMLNGCYRKATLFLASLWVLGAGWILLSEPARSMLSSIGLALPESVTRLWLSPVPWTAHAVVWSLAVYDAIATAAVRRRS